MKKIPSILIFILCFTAAFSQKYQIRNVEYKIIGMTKKYALEKAIEIDRETVFPDFEKFRAYIDDLELQFQNERNLSYAAIETKLSPELTEDEICYADLIVSTQDSIHFLAVPYPKYNSNDGFELKIKAKDTNFLGTFETLDFDINFQLEPNEDTGENDITFGTNLSYDFPFKLWKFDMLWKNDIALDYTIGRSMPEFDIGTGFLLSIPFNRFSIDLDFTQSIINNFDYEEYGDALYFSEYACLSVPIKVAAIENFGDIKWTPSVSFRMNLDKDGINEENDDLSSPAVSIGHSISTSRINWLENFRDGLGLSFSQSAGYNFQREQFYSSVNAEIQLFKAFKYAGISGRIRYLQHINTDEEIGGYIRGVRDEQRYKDSNLYALKKSASAIIGSIDIPVHIITTDWNGWTEKIFGEGSKPARYLRWMRYFDFELQFSPFFDFAFTHNEITGKTFSMKDGWYAGGLEVLVFPAKWRSFVVRASFGIDLARTVFPKVLGSMIDTYWRDDVSPYELSIGIGLHY